MFGKWTDSDWPFESAMQRPLRPGRHIPLNDAGFTIDRYSHLGTSNEVETAVKAALQKSPKVGATLNSVNRAKI
jgi:hypothetical protein